MKYAGHILMLMLMGVLLSCEEPIVLDLDQSPQKLVIEGLLTNRAKDQVVKISRTVDFYSTAQPEPVTDALVKVESSSGETIEYVQSSPGIYTPQDLFAGEIGKKYKLTVRIGNDLYESEDELLRVVSVDSLGYRLSDNPTQDQKDEGHLYEILLYMKEPKDTEDYYMFKFFRNDSVAYNQLNDIYITSDEVLGESIYGFPGPVFYAAQDTARMEMFSLSRRGYVYYSDLTNLLFSDGGMFGPVPANPRSNISNGALGFFQVSAVTTAEVILKN